MAKKKYLLRFPVEQASGEQCYEVEADSPEEALEIYERGDVECSHEEIEVTKLGEPQIDEIED